MLLCCALVATVVGLATGRAGATTLSLCGNAGSPDGPIEHVIVLMLENQSYSTVVNGTAAPYQSQTLAHQCGVGTAMFATTHASAANYLATTAGQYPANSAKGCASVAGCSSSADNLFAQADRAGLGWRNYVEGAPATPSSCLNVTSTPNVTKIGHQPGLFYGLADCPTDLVPVPDLTAASGPFWNDLQGGTLPAVSWVSPNQAHVGEGTSGLGAADTWLKGFLARVQGSTTYQAGRTAIFVTYDEGSGTDAKQGENCTDQAKDTAGSQESCHVPLFVVYPYTSASTDSTFLDHYSLTRTVDDLFGWPRLAHAADAQTTGLVGRFGLPDPASFAPSATDTGTATSTDTSTATSTETSTDTSTDTSTATDTQTPTPTFQPLTSTCGNPAPAAPMPPRHLIVIMMENESRGSIVGSTKAPYQTALAHQCGELTNMWAITHPSLPNYLAMNSGVETLGTFHDCPPRYATQTCISNDANVFQQLQTAGLSWRGYAEDMTGNCQLTGNGSYAPRHNAPVYFTDLATAPAGQASACATYDVPMGSLSSRTGQFYSDLASGGLPSYSLIAPNLVDDAHSSSITTGDSYLQQLIPLITAGPNYQAGDTDIVVTYDEGAGSDKKQDEDCTNQALDTAGKQSSCNIPFIVAAPYEPAGTSDAAFCTLYCLTRTIESTFGLPLLGHAADPATRDLTTELNLSPPGTGTTATSTDTSTDTSTVTSTDTSTVTGTSTATTTETTTATTTATTTTAPPPTVRQYVGNTGVESSLSGWEGTYNGTSRISLSQVPGGSHDGSWALRILNSSSKTLAAGVTNKGPVWVDGSTVPTVAGTTYTASVWVNGGSGTKVTLRLNQCAPSGSSCGTAKTSTVTLAPATWTQISVPITATASGKSLTMAVYASLPAGAAILADTFSLTSPLP